VASAAAAKGVTAEVSGSSVVSQTQTNGVPAPAATTSAAAMEDDDLDYSLDCEACQ
jgi:hypothetical protein